MGSTEGSGQKRGPNKSIGSATKKKSRNFVVEDDNDDDDDDIEVLEQELTENDFKCPYTGSKFVIAMSNSNCKHHLDDKAIVDMCKGGKTWFNCPVAACSEKWTVSPVRSFKRDFEFEVRMKEFFNTQNQKRRFEGDNVISNSTSVAGNQSKEGVIPEYTAQMEGTADTNIHRASTGKNNVPLVDLSLDDSGDEDGQNNVEDRIAREVREIFGYD